MVGFIHAMVWFSGLLVRQDRDRDGWMHVPAMRQTLRQTMPTYCYYHARQTLPPATLDLPRHGFFPNPKLLLSNPQPFFFFLDRDTCGSAEAPTPGQALNAGSPEQVPTVFLPKQMGRG